MAKRVPKTSSRSESHAVLRKRNQITLPAATVQLLGIREGDTVVIEATEKGAVLRPVRRSYAGVLAGAYGEDYLKIERDTWK